MPTDDALPEKGRALDVMVAERVMGWRLVDGVALPDAMKGFKLWVAPGQAWTSMVADGHDPAYFVPAYSTSIADAWRVVERFRHLSLVTHPDWPDDARWCATLYNEDTPANAINCADAPTAPEAICRAALRALSGDQTP